MVKFIRYSKIFRLYEFIQPYIKYSLHVEENFSNSTVLVIAPHPDDEAIGCGGAICKYVNNGCSVNIVYCTSDGEKRDNESLSASEILGVKDSIYLKYPVESLLKQNDFYIKLINIFDEIKPDIVFIPFIIDNHTDHRAVNSALIKVSEVRKFDFMIYAYPVWLPLYPNIVFDISQEWLFKKKAIECYKSQLATRDYIKMSYSLGQYWGVVKGRNIEVAETFFKATFKEYISLAKKVLL